MRVWTIIIPAIGLVIMLYFLAKPAYMTTKNSLFALGMFGLLCLNGFVAYKEHRVSQEIAEISLAIDAIKAEDASGRRLTAEDLKSRSERLSALAERLAAIRSR